MPFIPTLFPWLTDWQGQGDETFIPEVSRQVMNTPTSISLHTRKVAAECLAAMVFSKPGILGYPTSAAQSAYHPNPSTSQEVHMLSNMTVRNSSGVENTRIVKHFRTNPKTDVIFDILQASMEKKASVA